MPLPGRQARLVPKAFGTLQLLHKKSVHNVYFLGRQKYKKIVKNKKKIQSIARQTLTIETETVAALHKSIDDDFVDCIEAILNTNGRVIVTGIGKSAIVGQKTAATFNSTGTPAIFMHAADAVHGDLGMIQPADIVLCISKSGLTAEVKVLVPLVRNLGNPIIGMVGNRQFLPG